MTDKNETIDAERDVVASFVDKSEEPLGRKRRVSHEAQLQNLLISGLIQVDKRKYSIIQ
jgi:hypothetical protein